MLLVCHTYRQIKCLFDGLMAHSPKLLEMNRFENLKTAKQMRDAMVSDSAVKTDALIAIENVRDESEGVPAVKGRDMELFFTFLHPSVVVSRPSRIVFHLKIQGCGANLSCKVAKT